MAIKILFVDDEPDWKFLINANFQNRIKNHEYEFLFAEDGVDALEKIQKNSDLDLVVTDIRMPRMDGLTLMSHLHQMELPLRTIIVSANDEIKNIRFAMNQGAYDFLVKPLDFEDMARTIQKCAADVRREKLQRSLIAQAETSIMEEEERYRSLIEQLPDGIIIKDKEITYVNQSGMRILHTASPEMLIGKHFSELCDDATKQVMSERLQKLQSPGEVAFYDNVPLKCVDGLFITTNVRIIPFFYRGNLQKMIIFTDITELKKTEAMLKREEIAREAAEQAGQLKDEFMGYLAHELRTPLNTVLANVSFLELSLEDDEFLQEEGLTQTDLIHRIKQGGEILHKLIQNILELQKLESGKIPMRFRTTNLNPLVRTVVDSFATMSRQKGLQLHFESTVANCATVLDESHFAQVIRNLVGNAIKFTRYGKVEVTLSCTEKEVLVAVKDTGCGVPQADLKNIFNRFEQVRRKQHEQQGMGLGLTYCRHVINLHQGTIDLQSEENRGSTFTIRIPRDLTANHPE
ncbi:MAG: response regulator [SAR324 cluster bacterium]|nr:response regulator [SAR324 cluster bacterium]